MTKKIDIAYFQYKFCAQELKVKFLNHDEGKCYKENKLNKILIE